VRPQDDFAGPRPTLVLSHNELQSLVEHVESRTCGSCCAYFSPALLGDLERGKIFLTEDDAREIFVALLDCGSLETLQARLRSALRE
jgi:hypothetical protein